MWKTRGFTFQAGQKVLTVAYAKSGVQGFALLHGVTWADDPYYRQPVEKAVKQYMPCLSSEESEKVQAAASVAGRVTAYLAEGLDSAVYDFYLCGNGAMIGQASRIIDTSFPDSRVYVESFFT